MSEEEKKDIENDESEDVTEGKATEGKPKKKAAKDKSKKQIADLQEKVDSVQDDYLRAEAEIQNMQNRNKKERADLLKYGSQSLAKDIVPVVDDLERALEVDVSDDNGKQLKYGIEMVQKKLNKALADNNITAIDEDSVDFDPNLHQAVQTVPADDDHPINKVVSVLQKGYKLNDRVLRPAMVVVSQ